MHISRTASPTPACSAPRAALLVALVVAGLHAVCAAQSTRDLRNDEKSTGDVLTYGMGYGQQRFSPLRQINRGNVRNLVPVWNLSLDNSANVSTQPLVVDGVIYVATHDATVAVDALTGRQRWKAKVELPADIKGFLCCGLQTRGLAVHDGLLYRTTLDAHVLALHLKDGSTAWNSTAADYKQGYSMTHAPLVAGDVLITGISGGEYGTRGFLKGWDLATGREIWTLYTTPAPGEPGYDTWKAGAADRGGAPTWLTGSYDPDLDLVYWGTGNGGPWNAAARGGDSLYICSVLAIRPGTGAIVWYYQFSPGDAFDYDAVNEFVLADVPIRGQVRKTLLQANRNGFFYVLDRANGELLAARQYGKRVNWASGIDMMTGRPIDTPVTALVRRTEEMSEYVDLWPSAFGSKNWMPMAYDPRTRRAFANTLNFGWRYKTVKQDYNAGGAWFLGVEVGGWLEPLDGYRGYLTAIDVATGKLAWEYPTRVPYWAGVLATAGDLVFTGAQTGEFMAFDSTNGRKLWQFQTGSGITGIPITWERKGRQYVTVTSGSATLYAALASDPNLPQVPAGGSLWTFALH